MCCNHSYRKPEILKERDHRYVVGGVDFGFIRDPQASLTVVSLVFLVLAVFALYAPINSKISPGLSIISILAGSIFAVKGAYETIRERKLDVNLLMLLAAVGAVVIGDFIEAAGLLFLFSLSGALESLAMGKTRKAIEALVKLRPDEAILLRNGEEVLTPVKNLLKGDIVKVMPFSSIPTDGIVEVGRSSIDQSAMTGESRPVEVESGAKVLAGTQNQEGLLQVQVTAGVGDTTLDKIVHLVEEAQENKASGEKISIWFGEKYTLFVLSAFIVSFGIRLGIHQPFSIALYGALTLLVGLSPCALVISTPATTLSALAWAARQGLLIRGGEFIERAGEIDTIAFDKTGTLTAGKPVLHEICVCDTKVIANGEPNQPHEGCWSGHGEMSQEAKMILRSAAAVEQYSTHPLAQAVLTAARQQGLDIPEVGDATVVPGRGLMGTLNNQRVIVGTANFIREQGVADPAKLDDRIVQMQNEGLTASYVSSGNALAALGFMDEPRREAIGVMSELRELGIKRLIMLSGDNHPTAKAIGQSLGLDEARGELLPADKSTIILDLNKTNKVMMVGDGVNDAPSLAGASVGVAMGGLGSDVALEAADVVLMNDRIDLIPQLIRLGRKTRSVVRGNLIFAAGVIIVLTLSSLFGHLPLVVAVIGHEGSTILVILSGLRLLNGPGKKLALS